MLFDLLVHCINKQTFCFPYYTLWFTTDADADATLVLVVAIAAAPMASMAAVLIAHVSPLGGLPGGRGKPVPHSAPKATYRRPSMNNSPRVSMPKSSRSRPETNSTPSYPPSRYSHSRIGNPERSTAEIATNTFLKNLFSKGNRRQSSRFWLNTVVPQELQGYWLNKTLSAINEAVHSSVVDPIAEPVLDYADSYLRNGTLSSRLFPNVEDPEFGFLDNMWYDWINPSSWATSFIENSLNE